MQCEACGQENRPGAAFCGDCGQGLGVTSPCGACGAANAAGQKFCDTCGQDLAGAAAQRPARHAYTPKHLTDKILTSRAALQGERKQVTVLFADIQGSMDLAEREDPEEWHRMMDRFFSVLADGVHRFEGTINQYTGDGVMALFGAPIAHEDHAQRACYAALHLRRALAGYANELRRTRGLNFSVRMGLNSGEVVVGAIGDDLRMDYTALGHTVGLAARMEALAESGRAYLTGDTAALVDGLMNLRDLGEFTVKGVSHPVQVYDLLEAGAYHTRFDVARARGLSRFVGRSAELAVLEDALQRMQAGDRVLVDIVGEPGIGKSRLCHEFLEHVRAQGIRVLEAHGVPHGKHLPLHPFLGLYRAAIGLEDTDSPEVARQKIAGAMVLIDPAMQERLPVLFELLGVPDPDRPAPPLSPEARQQQLLDVTRRLTLARTRRESSVFVYEDLHWFDEASLGLLRQLAQEVTRPEIGLGRTLVIANYRPDFDPQLERATPVQRVRLAPLSDTDAADLLRDILGIDPSTASLARRVHAATQGNPFFIEEVVRALVETRELTGERGAYRLQAEHADVAIPATVQAVLAARIDRLHERDKTILQTAAVIGRRFMWSVLQRVTQLPAEHLRTAIHRLVDGGFVVEEVLYPESEYAFQHPLTHEVAYRTQLAALRAATHETVARSMRDVYGDASDDRAGRIAHHYAEAGVALEASRFYRRAAEWAARSAPREAVKYWRRVHTLATEATSTRETSELRLAACSQIMYLGWSYDLKTEEAESFYREGLGLAEELDDQHGHARLLDAYARVRGGSGHTDDSMALRKRALQLADQTDDFGLRFGLRTRLAGAYAITGRLQESLDIAEAALAEAGNRPAMGISVLGFDPYLRFLMRRGALFAQMGRLTESARDLEQALQLAKERGDRETLISTHASYVNLLDFLGEFRPTLDHAVLAVELAEVSGAPYLLAVAYSALGRAHLLNEEWDAALESTQRALSAVREGRTFRPGEPWMLANLAWAHLGRGEVAEARGEAEEALALATQYGARVFECMARLALSRVLTTQDPEGERGVVEAHLATALQLVEETGAVSYEPLVYVDQAAIAGRLGDTARAQEHLRAAARVFAQMGATARAERIKAI